MMLLQNNVFMEKQYFEPEHRSGVLFKNPHALINTLIHIALCACELAWSMTLLHHAGYRQAKSFTKTVLH